ncbi:MAG: PhzF family phenazine biosynthesis protein [Thermoplasmata archaeon]|nr:PhzF family phenazine biosynthesis protein [Thermoplasmata archaeon]
MRRLPFATIDVFTTRVLEGNSLAVLPDAQGLTDAEMLAIAREFNLPETTFVIRRDEATERAKGIRSRIFTTREEMPFAGHPTLGTAAVLRSLGAGDEVSLELNVGTVPVRFSERDHLPFGEMTQLDPTFGAVHDRGRVAETLGVPVGELDPEVPIQTVSTGNPVAIVPFLRLATLQQWTPDWGRMERYLRGTDARFFYAICPETVDPEADLHARMPFWIGDDPATGSAAGPAAAWMVRNGRAPSGSTVEIEQGLEVHRRSRISARVDRTGGQLTNVRVGGHFVPVSRGELTLP